MGVNQPSSTTGKPRFQLLTVSENNRSFCFGNRPTTRTHEDSNQAFKNKDKNKEYSYNDKDKQKDSWLKSFTNLQVL